MANLPTNRLTWLVRIFLVWAILILGRLMQLQVLQRDSFRQQAMSQQQHVIEITAPRGAILDRNGERLAMSVPCDSVCVNPMRIPNLSIASEIMAKILGLDPFELHQTLRRAADQRNGFVWVKRKVTEKEAQRLRDLKMDWIEFRTESRREYAYGQVASHVLGGVNFEEKGNSGIELALDEDLSGRPGMLRVTNDARQRGYAATEEIEATPGKAVRLTLLTALQQVAEQEIEKAVLSHKGKSGSIVAMDPNNGEVLAMANYPTYDPNQRPLRGGDVSARQNLAVEAAVEPGSVFKVITVSAALETTRLRPTSVVNCGNGSMTLSGKRIGDTHSFASLPVEDVLAYSSNGGAITIGLRTGKANLYEYITRFGFGRRTGLSLPGESAGMVHPLKKWRDNSIGYVSIGHEVSVTTVQLAQACSIIANGGFRVKPKIVLGGPVEPKTQVLRPETAIAMKNMMEGVVIKPHGTGFRHVKVPGYTSAGKTGTAQMVDQKTHTYTHMYNASFMGFAPVNQPRVVVVVTVNGTSGQAGYGGPVSAPAFSAVTSAALRLLDVPKNISDDVLPQTMDGEVAESVPGRPGLASTPMPLAEEKSLDQRTFLAEKSPTAVPNLPNFLGLTMRETVRRSAEQGIPVDFAGRGLVRAQDPPAGYPLLDGRRLRLQLGN